MSKKRAFVFLVLLFGGCNLAPRYERPPPEMPVSYRLELEEEKEVVDWWTLFGDEVLSNYIEEALKNNKDLQAAMWRVCEYLGEVQVAKSPLMPQITPKVEATKQRLPADEDFIGGNNKIIQVFSANVGLAYELDFWGVIRNRSKEANALYLASKENRRAAVLTLVGSVAHSYIHLLQLDLQIEIAYRILKSRKDFLEIANYRFEGGITSQIEMEQAASLYQEALSILKALEKKVAEEENALCVLVGRSPQSVKRGKPIKELYLPKGAVIGTPEELLIRRPDIMAKEQELIAANANIGVARGVFFPQLDFATLIGSESLSLGNLLRNKAQVWEIGGALLQRLFTGGKLTGNLKKARAKKEVLAFEYQEVILRSLQEVNDALVSFTKNKELFAARDGEVKALQKYLDLAWCRYYDGLTEYLTVLDAETRVFNIELDEARAWAEQFIAIIDLYKSLGGGWVESLDQDLRMKKLFPEN